MKIKVLFKRLMHKISRAFELFTELLKLSISSPKAVLLDIPTHGNTGDQAIATAEKQYLKDHYPNKIFCYSHYFCERFIKVTSFFIQKKDVVLIHGGGFIGSLWPREHKVFIDILKAMRKRKIIVFPQTAFFYEKDRRMLDEFIESVNKCSDLTICLREKRSYDYLKSLNLSCGLLLVPDIVMYLKDVTKCEKGNGKILLCLRKDSEKVIDKETLINNIKDAGFEYDITDTVLSHGISEQEAQTEVNKKIEEFSRYDLVVCDRLHGMIFSTLAGTPCIALDNVSQKVSGVYEWIRYIPQIVCINEQYLTTDLINRYKSEPHFDFDRSAIIEALKPLEVLLSGSTQ